MGLLRRAVKKLFRLPSEGVSNFEEGVDVATVWRYHEPKKGGLFKGLKMGCIDKKGEVVVPLDFCMIRIVWSTEKMPAQKQRGANGE